MKRSVLASIVAATFAATPALSASPPAMLDCAVSSVPPQLARNLGRAATDTAMADREAPKVEFGKIVSECIARFSLAEPKRQAYARYSLARVVREEQLGLLKTAGLDPTIADKALGFGPGKFADFSQGVPAEFIEKLVGAYVSAGVDPEKVPEANWEVLGGYASMSSLMWAMRAELDLP